MTGIWFTDFPLGVLSAKVELHSDVEKIVLQTVYLVLTLYCGQLLKKHITRSAERSSKSLPRYHRQGSNCFSKKFAEKQAKSLTLNFSTDIEKVLKTISEYTESTYFV
jgi:hypothetical protein